MQVGRSRPLPELRAERVRGPDVFRLVHEELLEWEYVVDDERGSEVRQAVRACPVRARNSSDSRGPRHRLVDPDRIDDRPTWCERPHERGI